MKKSMLAILICSAISVLSCNGQKNEIKNVEQTIKAFSKAGDDSNADKLATFLDDNYRVVMNRLFGSEAVSVIPKAVYLEKIRSKEWGGDQRVLTIQNTVINGSSASAQVTFKGSKMTFVSLISLVKDSKGEWKLVSDIPVVI